MKIRREKMEYKDWLMEWLYSYVKPTTKERTFERYAQTIRVHILPRLGGYELDELTPITLQRYINWLLTEGNTKTGKGLSSNSINSIISVIKSSLKTAVMVGTKKIYDSDKIRRPKSEGRKMECFTASEQKKIENAVMRSRKSKLFGVVLCLYTGLRIGELLALTWSDIDFDKGMLTVNKTCHDGSGGGMVRITDKPKTRTSNRVIPIPKQLIPRLRELKRKSASEYVVCDAKRVVYLRSYQKLFAELIEKLKIPHKGFHALRHTFATRALECGMDVKSLSEILGHKNPTVTLNTYTHSLMEHKVEMMNKLGKLL